MNPALLLLMRMQARAAFRRAFRGLRTIKGAMFVIVGAVMFAAWLASAIFSTRILPHTDPLQVRLYAPLVLLLLCIVTTFSGAGDRSISFTPGEVNFLFPGPFTRRELLFFKLARTLAGVLLSGLIMSLVLLRHASGWPAALAGAMLTMLFVQLFTLALVMVGQTIGERAYSKGRKFAVGIVVAGLLAIIVPQLRKATTAGANSGPDDAPNIGRMEAIAVALDRSPVARVLLSPTRPFVHTFTAESLLDGIGWGLAALAVDGVLLLLVLRLDADYREASLAASQRVFARLQRMRRGKGLTQIGMKAGVRRRSRLSMLPFLGGAGPTVWRQLATAGRTSKGLIWFLVLISAGVVPAFVTQGRHGSAGIIVAAGSWGTMLLTTMLKFDFRGDLDQMEWLKALPLSPIATAVGQLAVPVLVLTVVQTFLIAAGVYVAKPDERLYLLAALPFLVPFNLLLIGVENLMFLLFPSREAGAAPGDVGLIGRNIVFFITKLLVVFAAAGVAGLFGEIAWLVSGHKIAAAGGAALLVLCSFAAALVPCVGFAYKRFDPSRDTPA